MDKKPKILVVDDEGVSRTLIKNTLKSQNFDVIEALSGEEALTRLKDDSEIDVILLDIVMPGIDGFEVLNTIKSNPDMESIKVIMLTATAGVKERVRAFSGGASDFLTKPFKREEIIYKIETQLALKQTDEDLKQVKGRNGGAEEKLVESEAKLRTIYEAISDGINVTDLKGNITDVNEASLHTFGYTKKEEIIGRNTIDLVAEKDHQKLKDHMAMTLKTGQGCRKEYTFLDNNKKEFTGEKNTVLIKSSVGNPMGFVNIIRGITDRKQKVEEIKQKDEELQVKDEDLEQKVNERTQKIEKLLQYKDEFINQLGHGIRVPLTSLTSFLPVIEKNETDPKSKELIEVCIRNTGYIKNLISSTLQLSRLNSPDTVFDINETHLFDVVDSVLFDNQAIIEDNCIEIENKIGMETIVLADKLRIREVFNNLITNAIKFSKDGGKLTIGVKENSNETDGFATISVRDTGIGLDDRAKSNLFKGFYKADRSNHEPDSSGLGLVICKQIIEKHGGKIWAESPGEDKGTTFYFTIHKKQKIEHIAVLAG